MEDVSIFSQWTCYYNSQFQSVSGSDAADPKNNLTQTRSSEFSDSTEIGGMLKKFAKFCTRKNDYSYMSKLCALTFTCAHTHDHAKYTHRMPPAMHLCAYMHNSTKHVIVFMHNIATQCLNH